MSVSAIQPPCRRSQARPIYLPGGGSRSRHIRVHRQHRRPRGPAALPRVGVPASAQGRVRGAGAGQRVRPTARAAAVSERFGDRVELIALDRPARKGRERLRADEPRARALVPAAERGLRADARRGRRAARRAPARSAGRASRAPASSSPGGAPQPSAWRFPGVRAALAGAVFAHRRLTVQSRGELTREVDWVQSAGMLVRRDGVRAGRPARPRLLRVLGRGRLAAARARCGLVGAVRAGRDDHAPRAALGATPGRTAADRRVRAQPRPLHAQAPRPARPRSRCAC